MMSSGDERSNISGVVANGLCHSCGACSGVCPEDAISFEETAAGLILPVVDSDGCSGCGQCLDVCPGRSLGPEITGELPEDPFTGRSIGSFVGKSKSESIYADSQSGGIATELILHALRSGDISGAVVVKMSPGVSPRPEALLATTEEEVISAQKSKYTPVPLLEVIGSLGRTRGAVAITGLSCHIHGIIRICDSFPDLKERIRYRIGLICDRSLSCASIDYLAMKAGFSGDEEKDVVFRDKSCGGFPGDVRVSSADGRSVIIRGRDRKRIRPCLTPPRCHMCFDKMNVLSDVTIGDPHGIGSADRKNGESICIARNEKGLALVESAAASGNIVIREIPYSDIVRGQKIERKRIAWREFCEEWQALGRSVPDYYTSIRKHAGNSAGHAHGEIDNALRLSAFVDRNDLLEWLKENDRKDLLLNALRNAYNHAMQGGKRFISRLRGGHG